MVGDLMRDPLSTLPAPLRAQIISVGLALHREMDLDEPDFRRVSEHSYDICEYLRQLHDQGELDTAFQPLNMAVPSAVSIGVRQRISS